jgi:predicted porin
MLKTILLSGVAVIALAGTALANDEKIVDVVASTTDVKIFGNAQAFVEGGTADGKDLEVKTSDSYVGVKLSTDPIGMVNVFGELSMDVDINGDGNDDITSRYGYLGVSNPVFGKLSFGKQVSQAEKFVDFGDVWMASGNAGVQKPGAKVTNSLKYENTIKDITFGTQAQMLDGATDETLDQWQIGASWKGIVGVNWATDEINDINYYGIGGTYSFGPIMVAGSYTIQDTNTTDVKGYEVVLGYTLDKATILGGFSDTDAAGDDGVITGGVHYTLYKDATLFVEADYDRDDTETTYRGGISVSF